MLLATNTDLPLPAWSHDGSKVVVAHTTSGRLTEIDPASGAERELPPVDVRGGARIDLIVPQADRLLVQTTRRSADVFAATAP